MLWTRLHQFILPTTAMQQAPTSAVWLGPKETWAGARNSIMTLLGGSTEIRTWLGAAFPTQCSNESTKLDITLDNPFSLSEQATEGWPRIGPLNLQKVRATCLFWPGSQGNTLHRPLYSGTQLVEMTRLGKKAGFLVHFQLCLLWQVALPCGQVSVGNTLAKEPSLTLQVTSLFLRKAWSQINCSSNIRSLGHPNADKSEPPMWKTVFWCKTRTIFLFNVLFDKFRTHQDFLAITCIRCWQPKKWQD